MSKRCLSLFVTSFYLYILSLFAVNITAHAQLVSNDKDYLVYSANNYRFIFSEENEKLIKSLVAKNQWLQNLYQKDFNWKFDEDAVLVLASSRNQIANGFATQYPRLMTYFYDGGPEFIDVFAVSSWLDVLLVHETAHLYQLNNRTGYSSFLKNIFGNSAPSPAMPFTYTITPHIFTPTFMMEGNAVFNEGRFGNGGRLYSGQYRALFLQLLRDEKVTADRLINDHIDWPFGTEKYIVGGYFNSQLAEKFGTQRTDRFFQSHSYNAFWPFNLSGSFKDQFDETYMDVLEDLKLKYQAQADKQSFLDTQKLTWSYEHSGFTKLNNQIAFMTNSLEGLPKLCVLNLESEMPECQKIKLPFGRVFKYKNNWVSAAYAQVHPTEIQASLFEEGFTPIESFNNRFVYQLDDKNMAYADSIKSFDKTILYKNSELVGDVQSSPLLDAQGNIYYFKQNGSIRQLFRNHEKLFEFKGYYGRVTDLDDSGHIYFTAATESGSGLFVWDGKKISKALKSDLVFDAKLLNASKVIAAEITSRGIEYRIGSLTSIDEKPAFYHYSYNDEKLMDDFQEVRKTAAEENSKPQTLKAYSPLREMELNGIDPSIAFAEIEGTIWLLNARWSDPLQRYLASLAVSDTGWNSYASLISFKSQVHRMNWALSSLYQQDPVIEKYGPFPEDERVKGRSADTEIKLEFSYALLKSPLWASEFSFGYLYENTDIEDSLIGIVTPDNSQAGFITYDLNYSYKNSLDFEFNRLIGLSLTHLIEGEGSSWENKTPIYTGKISTEFDLFNQSFLSANYQTSLADGPRDTLELEKSQTLSLDPTNITQYSKRFLTGGFFKLSKTNAEFKQAFRLGIYHRWIPIGLRRFAPFIGYSEFYGSRLQDAAPDTLFHEKYYGVDAELLFLHKFPVRLLILGAENSLDPEYNLTIKFSNTWNF